MALWITECQVLAVAHGRRIERVRHRIGALLLALALATTGVACGLLPFTRAPNECAFPEDTRLAFAGRTTLKRLGLNFDLPHSETAAMVYVTAEPVPHTFSVPHGAEVPPDQRLYCAIFDDDAVGLSAHGGVPDDWSPPD